MTFVPNLIKLISIFTDCSGNRGLMAWLLLHQTHLGADINEFIEILGTKNGEM